MSVNTLSTTAEEILPENKLRKSFVIQNEDSAINIFIKFEKPGNSTATSTDHDHRVGPGAAIALNSLLDGKEQIQSRVTAIAASGTPLISLFETEEDRR